MSDVTNRSSKSICTFCQTPIKNEAEEYSCPSCSSPYHTDCWFENKGCAVYGCGEKLRDYREESSMRDAIINIEYLINKNQFSEAIFEAKQFLKIDRNNSELKNHYNKAVSLINNKINLMTSGDEAFNKKDYKSAEIYYKNVLKYTDEVETNFINARLEISKEKIPEQKRRAVYHNVLIIVIIIAILSAIGYLGYYTFILKEDRDYSELVKSDNARDLKTMETMIGKYENFLRSYTNGKNKKRAIDRINQYSYQIASIYYKDDWKLALRHFNKIENTLDQEKSKNLKTNIYNTAFNEYKQKLSNAKKLNSISKYSESLNELNNAINIVSSFPGTDMTKETEIIQSNMTLLNKKISSILKINDIEREIREKEKELSGISSSGNSGTVLLTARITGFSEPDIYLSRESESGKTVAVRNVNKDYKIGQIINIESLLSGKITVPGENGKDITVPLYIPYYEQNLSGENITGNPEKEAAFERVRNLKIQKEKLDSLLKMSLL